jgi:hypothetical protein
VQGEKVFEIRWDNAGGFKVVHYDQGDWQRALRAWPEPIRSIEADYSFVIQTIP